MNAITWQHVFAFLEIKDYFKLSLVCHLFHEVACLPPLWRKVLIINNIIIN